MLGALINLESLRLDFNQLTGPIPARLGELVKLELLRLDFNQLAGPIPAEAGRLSPSWNRCRSRTTS